jgi:DNA-binding PucR family transcriptional regulator
MLHVLNWNRHDTYLCLRIEAGQNNIRMLSSVATINHIEMQIPECRAFLHKDGITVLVNLSYTNSKTDDILSRLAIILREGLLKMGVSSEIPDFLQLPQGCHQAEMALELGQKSTSMNWCYRFDDYILEFLLSKGGESLAPELLCSNKLLILKKYDQENNTKLYQTLKTYLELERNVLQSAKALFIHRSTLFYRVERIEKLADLHLDDPKERLVLQLSFYILEQGERSDLADSTK